MLNAKWVSSTFQTNTHDPWIRGKRLVFLTKRMISGGFSPELQRGVNGLSVSRCMTILPAYYSGGCWWEYTCMKEELRLTLDSWFVNFTRALGESWGHTPPATALGNFAPLKCKWLACTFVRVCVCHVCVCACVAGWVGIHTDLRVSPCTSVGVRACPRNLS